MRVNKHPNKPWHHDHDKLMKLVKRDFTIGEMAKLLGRTEGSIRNYLYTQKVKYKGTPQTPYCLPADRMPAKAIAYLMHRSGAEVFYG